jgi:hypothetical protein
MAQLHFRAKIAIIGVNPYVLVGPAQAQKLQDSWRKPMPVTVQINGKPDDPWHINMMPSGDGSFYLYLHGDVRKASDTKVGDTVTVDVAFDEAYQPMPPVPGWFHQALDHSAVAKSNWQALSPSRQKEVVRYLASLKSPDAQARNLQKVMDMLSGTSGRFMARDWKDGK